MAGEPDHLTELDNALAQQREQIVQGLELPPELLAVTDEAKHLTLVCPGCKSGEHLMLRSTRTSAVTKLERKVYEPGYRVTESVDVTDIVATAAWCTNCTWSNMNVNGDPWEDLVSTDG